MLVRAALQVVRRLWRNGFRYKKAGITLLGLSDAADVQGDLWTPPDTARSQTLMRTIDLINRTHGRDTVRLAVSGTHRPWRMRSDQRSPSYTTDWHQLLRV